MDPYAFKLLKCYVNYVIHDKLPNLDDSTLRFIIYCLRFRERYKKELNDVLAVTKSLDNNTCILWLVNSVNDNANIGRFITLCVCFSLIMVDKNISLSMLVNNLKSMREFETFVSVMQSFEPYSYSPYILFVSCMLFGFLTARIIY